MLWSSWLHLPARPSVVASCSTGALQGIRVLASEANQRAGQFTARLEPALAKGPEDSRSSPFPGGLRGFSTGLSEDFLREHPPSASSGVTQEGVIVCGFPSFAAVLTFSFPLAAPRLYLLEKASLLYPCPILFSGELGLKFF